MTTLVEAYSFSLGAEYGALVARLMYEQQDSFELMIHQDNLNAVIALCEDQGWSVTHDHLLAIGQYLWTGVHLERRKPWGERKDIEKYTHLTVVK